MTDSTSVPLKHHMVKKCALLAVMALEALRTIYFMVKAEAIADQLLEGMPLHRNSEEARKILAVAMYIGGALNLAYLLCMLVGVLLRHICIVTTLVVLQILGVFALVIDLFLKAVGGGGGYSASSNIIQSFSYMSALFGLAIAVLLYIYLRDIRQIRDEERRRAYNSVKYETA